MKQFNLEEYLKNPSRKVVTKSGRNARIICIDRKNNEYPVVALVKDTLIGGESINCYTKAGNYYTYQQSDSDLFFAPEKHEGWVNIFKDVAGNNYVEDSTIFNSKEDAEKEGKSWGKYITSVKVEWEE